MSEVLLDTDDLGAAESTLSAMYARINLTASPDPSTRFLVRQSGAGPVGYRELVYGAAFHYEAEPFDDLVLCVPHSGGFDQRPPGAEPVSAGAGAVMIVGTDADTPFSGTAQRGRYSHLVIDRDCLGEVAATHAGPDDEPVRLIGVAPVSATANHHLARLIDYIGEVAGSALTGGSPLLAGEIRRHVAATLLATFPNTARWDPTAQDRRDGTPASLRRAVAFIDDNAHLDISLADIAAAVHVTPRALQYMFRNHRQSTPLDYLRLVRMYRARAELVAANPGVATVNEIARRWGFAHAGRFARRYRERFGESPHTTLRAGS